MSFNWEEYLALAHELIGDSVAIPCGSNAKIRSSTSRAYYSAYCIARNYVENVTGDTSGKYRSGGSHSAVQAAYKRLPSQRAKKVATELERMQEAREKADYEEYLPTLPQLNQFTLLTARKVIDLVNLMQTGTP